VVTITGTELGSVTSVKFGSTDATSFTVDSDTSVTAISPPGAGVVAVTVADARGSSYASGGTYFRYGAEEPSCVIEPWECKGVGPPEEPPAGPPVEPPEPPVKPPAPPVKPFIEGPESPGVTAPSVVRTGASTPSTAHRCKHRWIQKAKRPQKKRRKAFLCASIR
jgi:hypothetical protein